MKISMEIDFHSAIQNRGLACHMSQYYESKETVQTISDIA
jgi:hypothetical protein